MDSDQIRVMEEAIKNGRLHAARLIVRHIGCDHETACDLFDLAVQSLVDALSDTMHAARLA